MYYLLVIARYLVLCCYEILVAGLSITSLTCSALVSTPQEVNKHAAISISVEWSHSLKNILISWGFFRQNEIQKTWLYMSVWFGVKLISVATKKYPSMPTYGKFHNYLKFYEENMYKFHGHGVRVCVFSVRNLCAFSFQNRAIRRLPMNVCHILFVKS